jgi:putative hemolysin
MTLLFAIVVLVLTALLTLASYVERIHAEMGRFLSREFQENIEAYELHVQPRLGRVRDRAPLTMSVLAQLSTAGIAMCMLYVVMRDSAWAAAEIAQALLAVVLVIIVFNRLLPFVFFTRTKGEWLVPFAPLLQALIYLLFPVTIVLSFCLQIAALAETNEPVEAESQAEAVDALIEAGQEEGILEEGDRQLIQSVVEFRDKTVREVMTPRPEVVAVSVDTTIEKLTEMLRSNPYSRIPVYEGTIDQIRGLVFSHDILQIADTDAARRTVRELMKVITFVPESKPIEPLMREMQAQKVHLAAVIDEYGSVAGVVTIEDLLEELVGEIADEHEHHADVVKENDHSYLIPGNTDVDRLGELFGIRPENVEATTVGGLVSEIAGRIPRTGEVIVDPDNGLRYEILQSTDRLIERLRVSVAAPADTVESKQIRA